MEGRGFLHGLRVIELADELGEYAGRVFAGLGAEVIKVEPVGGEATRTFGPFYKGRRHLNRSLHFWHYNLCKKSVVLDLDTVSGTEQFKKLILTTDVLLDTRPKDYLAQRLVPYDVLKALNPALIYTRISPFGDDGPWSHYVSSDLVHLALGGVMMNCGYDADPSGHYDTPPIAPQMWQAYHIVGEMAAIQSIAALIYRARSGLGQRIDLAVHDCVAKNTETDMPDWVYSRQEHFRRTGQHSFATVPGSEGAAKVPGLSRTKDGRWLYPYRTYLPGFALPFQYTVDLLSHYGCEEDLADPKYLNFEYLLQPEVTAHVAAVIDRFVSRYGFGRQVWKEAQGRGMPWAPVRRPEENVGESHWAARSTFAEVHYPELGKTFVHVNAKWECSQVPWAPATRAPLLGEHTLEILDEPADVRRRLPQPSASAPLISPAGKPFALSDVRVLDLSWLLASGGAGRFFTSLGADVVKVEHSSRVDGMRFGSGMVPQGGRSERDAAVDSIWHKWPGDLNRSGGFMEINAGKRSLALNLKASAGKEILTRLITQADIIIEGFSPGTMERMGLGYDRLREINPRIVYVQQSGLGQIGTYGALRSYGPTAQAFSGLTDMSGFPEPHAPAGIGYSYLDWFGAYQMALAMMAGLYRQRETGEGCWIDSSQVEVGIFLTGTAILDYTVNGRAWQRQGNRSPHKPAAPSGAYPVKGVDRWIAISAFTEQQWAGLIRVIGSSKWTSDQRFIDLEARLAHQDDLDAVIANATVDWDAFALQDALQNAGVPAGVCQTAQDRYEHDPQLRHLKWMVELDQSTIGRWPVKSGAGTLSETPPYIGGRYNRSGPNYGEDSDAVLREWINLTAQEIDDLRKSGAID